MNDETHVRLIPIDRIRIVNPRTRDKKKFERIVDSIAKLGLKKPITVMLAAAGEDGGETFDLVCGQGRLEAFIALGQRQIPALVRGLSKTDGLLASLIENIARRRVSSLDQIKLIQWMQQQGHGPAAIALKTGLGAEYVKDILGMLKNGEDRLLEAVLHGKIPVTIATQISGASDDESQRLLMEAYERKEMTQKSLSAFKRIIDQRRHFGRSYAGRIRQSSQRTTAESLVSAYKHETQRQRLMVRKAKICEARLLSISAAFKVLVRDEDYVTLLRAEKMEIMRAIDQGVTPEQIAKALDIDPSKIKANFSLLNGIHGDAIEILKNRPITAAALRLFRKVKAVRQIDMAQLMVSGNNYTWAYAEALIIGTPTDQLVGGSKKAVHGISPEEIARMEKEMEGVERDYRLHQEQFGENSLHLNAIQRYVKRLLENPKIKRFLGNRYPEILEEFQDLATLESL